MFVAEWAYPPYPIYYHTSRLVDSSMFILLHIYQVTSVVEIERSDGQTIAETALDDHFLNNYAVEE